MSQEQARRLLFQLYEEALAEMPLENIVDLVYAERDAVLRFAVIEGECFD